MALTSSWRSKSETTSNENVPAICSPSWLPGGGPRLGDHPLVAGGVPLFGHDRLRRVGGEALVHAVDVDGGDVAAGKADADGVLRRPDAAAAGGQGARELRLAIDIHAHPGVLAAHRDRDGDPGAERADRAGRRRGAGGGLPRGYGAGGGRGAGARRTGGGGWRRPGARGAARARRGQGRPDGRVADEHG